MHPSAVIALAFIASTGPVLAAPAAPLYSNARRQDTSEAISLGNIVKAGLKLGGQVPAVPRQAGSEAISLSDILGDVESVAKLLGLRDELHARQDDSEALSLGDILKDAESVAKLLGLRSEVLARQETDPSEAISLKSVMQQVAKLLTGGDLAARQETDPSEAISLGTIGTIASIGSSVIGALIDHFKDNGNAQQRRAAEELFARQASSEAISFPDLFKEIEQIFGARDIVARQETDPSEAISLGTIGTIASIGSSVIGALIDHFKNNGNAQQRRAAEELFARQDSSEAISFPDLFKEIEKIFGARDIVARQESDPSEALTIPSLGDAASIASIASSVVSVFHNLFGGDSSNQRRELIEVLSRAEIDASGALKIPSLGSLAGAASIGSAVVSVLHDIFGDSSSSSNTNAQRAVAEILARAEVDESGALKLPSLSSLGSIASLGISGLSILGSLFGGDDSQQQSREYTDFLARELIARSSKVAARSLEDLD